MNSSLFFKLSNWLYFPLQTKIAPERENAACPAGQGVLGSVLAAEMCPLDEPASAAFVALR